MKNILIGLTALILALNNTHACDGETAGMSEEEHLAYVLSVSDEPLRDYIGMMEECEKLQQRYFAAMNDKEKHFALKWVKEYLKHLKASKRNKEWIVIYKDRVMAIEQWVNNQ